MAKAKKQGRENKAALSLFYSGGACPKCGAKSLRLSLFTAAIRCGDCDWRVEYHR